MIRCKWRVNYENDIQIEVYTTSAVASQLGRHINLAFPYIEGIALFTYVIWLARFSLLLDVASP